MRLATPVIFGVDAADDFEDEAGGNAENKSVKSLTGEMESASAGECVRNVDVLLRTLEGGLLPAR